MTDTGPDAARRRLYVYSAGFLTQAPLRRILTLAGHDIRLGLPGPQDAVGVWGRSPTAARGEAIAARRGCPLLRIEDAFLRGIAPGEGGAPAGLIIDPLGVHFDAGAPSRVERILAKDPLDETSLIQRAKDAMGRIAALKLSKYNNHDLNAPLPPPGYVLVIDQRRDDASVRFGGASAATFRAMLAAARAAHPRRRIVIKAHPAATGRQTGHFGAADCDAQTTILTAALPPQPLLEGAVAVYAVTSQLGFEAILAGHRPHVFGQPFYAGWGLTQDENPAPRRGRPLSPAQLFAGAMILAPTWYDPCRDRLCSLEAALDQLEVRVRIWREDRAGHVAVGMRRWKRPFLRQFFGQITPVQFRVTPPATPPGATGGRGLLLWGANLSNPGPAAALRRVEDGFLRSRGLGARLVPPLSLIADDLGLHYDPAHESRLERLILDRCPPGGIARAERLLVTLRAAGLSKYNLPATPLPDLPPGQRILVPGQVEDDAAVRLTGGALRRNIDLLAAARAANPGAILLYKPHPDVRAGLRPGAIDPAEALRHADLILPEADPAALIDAVDAVWTLSSLLGFEALIRGRAVTCLGTPFYAGWGLTRDLGPVPARRRGHYPPLPHLVHAALIAYPRYRDPVSGLPCPAEVVAERLASGQTRPAPLALRLAGRAQRWLPGR